LFAVVGSLLVVTGASKREEECPEESDTHMSLKWTKGYIYTAVLEYIYHTAVDAKISRLISLNTTHHFKPIEPMMI
jgi:hypothetical protein